MDAVTLARIQFGFSVGFHFLFPATTLGLTFFILIVETAYLKTKNEIWRQASSFLVRLLALVFAMGVATGTTLEFSFGTNWAGYSRLAGDVFGAPVAMEGISAFALEAVFLAVLLFGRKKVSAGVYWLSAFVVFFASHLSGFWIVAANSWMHTPAGFKLEGGRAVLTSLGQALFNPSSVIRFEHTIMAGWITGASVTGAMAAAYLLKRRHEEVARKMLWVAAILLFITPWAQLVLGHSSAVEVDRFEPEKSAAMEGIFQTTAGAPLLAFGLPDVAHRAIRFAVGAPKLLSFLLSWRFDSEVTGLDKFPEKDWPPVGPVFTAFHLMVLFGFALIGLGSWGGWLLARGRLYSSPWFLRALIAGLPLPYLAFEFGWIATEMGRQPWIVYHILRTADAASARVPAGQILFSLLALAGVYLFLLVIFSYLVGRLVRNGPGGEAAGY